MAFHTNVHAPASPDNRHTLLRKPGHRRYSTPLKEQSVSFSLKTFAGMASTPMIVWQAIDGTDDPSYWVRICAV